MEAHRPTKKTPERIAAILKALRAGNTRAASARFAEIHRDTLHDWMQTDPSFSDAVEKAEADAEVRFVTRIATAAEETWQAAAWWLERRRPDDYRQQQTQHIQGSLQVGLSELAREARKVIAARKSTPAQGQE